MKIRRIREYIAHVIVIGPASGSLHRSVGYRIAIYENFADRLALVQRRVDRRGIRRGDSCTKCNHFIIEEKVTFLSACTQLVEIKRGGSITLVCYAAYKGFRIVEISVFRECVRSRRAGNVGPIHQRVNRFVFVAGSLNGGSSLGRPVQQVITARVNRSPFSAFNCAGGHLDGKPIVGSHMRGDKSLPLCHIVGVQSIARARTDLANIIKETRKLRSSLRIGRLHPL
ncbi:hypothetical protein D3C76_845960 [compost metagenome]